jgi:hypothetical protein
MNSVFKGKTYERFEDHFVSEKKTVDLSRVKFLHSGVDTLKQLYSCNLRSDVLTQIESHFERFSSDLINVEGYDFILSKGSKTSGYQYILKNLDAGFVVMLKSFYVEPDQNGSHVKIEVTPQRLYGSSAIEINDELRSLAYVFATNVLDKGVAVHICTDIHGYDVPDDFEHRLVTSARRQTKYNGGSYEFDISSVSCVYNKTESYTFGRPNAIQMSFYDKTIEAEVRDKLHFWESVWSGVRKGCDTPEDWAQPAYTSGDTVRRLEFRFHHGVIEDFERFVQSTDPDASIKNYLDIHKHLSGLWRYALNNFRLMDEDQPSYVDPVWQALSDDVVFFNEQAKFLYKRAYKKPSSDVNHRHIAHTLGNYIKVCSRRHLTPEFVVKCILGLGIEADLCSYFHLLQFGESELLPSVLYEFVSQRMMHHRLSGVGV